MRLRLVWIVPELAPEDLYAGLAAVADVIRYIHIEAGKVRVGIEEVQKVFSAQNVGERPRFAGCGQMLRTGTGQFRHVSARFGHLATVIGLQRLFVIVNLYPENFCSLGIVLSVAIAASETLHQRRPRSKLRDEHPGGNIHASLNGLGGDHDAVDFFLAVAQKLVLTPAFRCAKTRMDQEVRLPRPLLTQQAEQALRAVDPVKNYDGLAVRDVGFQHFFA